MSSPRLEGSHVYTNGDESAFSCMLPPDVVVSRLEDADENAFVGLPGRWWMEDDPTDEVRRTFYVKPKYVKCIAPRMVDDELDDGDDE